MSKIKHETCTSLHASINASSMRDEGLNPYTCEAPLINEDEGRLSICSCKPSSFIHESLSKWKDSMNENG